MDLIKAKQLEYALDVYYEYATSKENPINDYPNISVLWNYNEQLITCNLFKYQRTYPILEEVRNNSSFDANTSIFNGVNKRDPFSIIRHEIFSKIQNYNYEYLYLYKNPEYMLKFLIQVINQLDNSQIDTDEIDTETIYNVKSFNNSNSLDFMLISNDTELTPVSLISTAKD